MITAITKPSGVYTGLLLVNPDYCENYELTFSALMLFTMLGTVAEEPQAYDVQEGFVFDLPESFIKEVDASLHQCFDGVTLAHMLENWNPVETVKYLILHTEHLDEIQVLRANEVFAKAKPHAHEMIFRAVRWARHFRGRIKTKDNVIKAVFSQGYQDYPKEWDSIYLNQLNFLNLRKTR